VIDLSQVDELNPSLAECAAMIDQADEYYWHVAAEALFGIVDSLRSQLDAERAARSKAQDGCRAMLGLVQLVLGRDDLTQQLRDVLSNNHRIAEAEAALADPSKP
jgi:hypothetical protein